MSQTALIVEDLLDCEDGDRYRLFRGWSYVLTVTGAVLSIATAFAPDAIGTVFAILTLANLAAWLCCFALAYNAFARAVDDGLDNYRHWYSYMKRKRRNTWFGQIFLFSFIFVMLVQLGRVLGWT